MSYHKDREEFIAHFVWEANRQTHYINQSIAAARGILINAATHGRLSVTACNRELDAREAKKLRIAEKNIGEICARYDFNAIVGGDPRGYTVKVLFPSGVYNTLGGPESGYGVPQR